MRRAAHSDDSGCFFFVDLERSANWTTWTVAPPALYQYLSPAHSVRRDSGCPKDEAGARNPSGAGRATRPRSILIVVERLTITARRSQTTHNGPKMNWVPGEEEGELLIEWVKEMASRTPDSR